MTNPTIANVVSREDLLREALEEPMDLTPKLRLLEHTPIGGSNTTLLSSEESRVSLLSQPSFTSQKPLSSSSSSTSWRNWLLPTSITNHQQIKKCTSCSDWKWQIQRYIERSETLELENASLKAQIQHLVRRSHSDRAHFYNVHI